MAESSDAGDSTEAVTSSFFSCSASEARSWLRLQIPCGRRQSTSRMATEPSTTHISYLALARLKKGLVEAHHRSLEGKVSSQGRAANYRYNKRLQT